MLADSLTRLGPARLRTCQPVLAHRFARQRLADTDATTGLRPRTEPVVLFVCTSNAGRSQLAAALLERAAEAWVVVRSAGTPVARRTLSDTFAGIAPSSAPLFVLVQLVGGALGLAAAVVLYPGTREVAEDLTHAGDRATHRTTDLDTTGGTRS